MASIFQSGSISKLIRGAIAVFSSVMLVACGGGGGSPGTTTGSQKAGIVFELVDANNLSKNTVTTSSPLTARATVYDSSGSPAAGVVVVFTGGASSTLTPSAGTALTNSSGVATIKLSIKDLATAQAQAGSAEVATASATVGSKTVTAKLNYVIGAPAVSLRVVAPSSGSVSINAYQTTSIQVDVLADGVIYTAQPVTINFNSACLASGKATYPATVTTSNGRAQIVYTDKGCSATDNVTVSAPGAQSSVVNVIVAAPVAASVSFVSATPSDKAIVIKGSGGGGRTETAVLTFLVLDTLGQPLPNQVVSFSVNSTQPVSLQSESAISAADGKVVVSVNSGNLPTTFRVIASLATGQSTISDTITVTTGQPVQAAFSLSAGSYNIEGWDRDNQTTSINILLADLFGNPVADGTPVVFQTDSGAIGNSSIGGCVTANGACSVFLRSQNPRYPLGNAAGKRAGLATISVSSTSALVTLSGQIGVFFSGSTGAGATPRVFDITTGPGTGTEIFGGVAYDTNNTCDTFGIKLELNDVNFNPLPAGTSIASSNVVKVTVPGIFPATVPSIAPHDAAQNPTLAVASLATRQGSPHTVQVLPPTSCKVNGGSFETGTFDLKITSPLGISVLYQNFRLTYPIATPPVPPVTCTLPQVLQGGVCVTPAIPTLTIAIRNAADTAPASSVALGGDLTIKATVTDGTSVVANKLVTFALSPAIGTFNPPSKTALTNASGVATIKITGTVVGAGSVTGTASVVPAGGNTATTVSGGADFEVTP